mmetsp:Transcript_14228/g.32294  ORF Transcript_14228/g.32294 Transcript_14228/m.32294 type:complete len:241 (+) Transcript_14228:1996-2718(+)
MSFSSTTLVLGRLAIPTSSSFVRLSLLPSSFRAACAGTTTPAGGAGACFASVAPAAASGAAPGASGRASSATTLAGRLRPGKPTAFAGGSPKCTIRQMRSPPSLIRSGTTTTEPSGTDFSSPFANFCVSPPGTCKPVPLEDESQTTSASLPDKRNSQWLLDAPGIVRRTWLPLARPTVMACCPSLESSKRFVGSLLSSQRMVTTNFSISREECPAGACPAGWIPHQAPGLPPAFSAIHAT